MTAPRDIPRAYAGLDSDHHAFDRAITWLAEQVAAVGGQPLLYVPGRQNLDRDNKMTQLSKRIATATWGAQPRGGWSGGPVLAAWPDRKHLAEIDDDRRTRALCVIGWSPGDNEAWMAAHTPTMLDGQATPAASGVIDAVVARGLEALTAMVNHGNNLAGSMDKRDAIDILQRLHDSGHRFDPDPVYSWALANGWNARGAERLRDYAQRISEGKRPRLGMPSALRADIVQQWEDEATGSHGPA